MSLAARALRLAIILLLRGQPNGKGPTPDAGPVLPCQVVRCLKMALDLGQAWAPSQRSSLSCRSRRCCFTVVLLYCSSSPELRRSVRGEHVMESSVVARIVRRAACDWASGWR